MLDDRTIATICKVIGRLSTARLKLDFDISFKGCNSFNFVPVGFYKKIEKRQSSNNALTKATDVIKPFFTLLFFLISIGIFSQNENAIHLEIQREQQYKNLVEAGDKL